MANIAGSGGRGDMRYVVARLERLPYCSWHLKMRLIICTAWFFDAFDSIAIAYVLPPLIGLWHLNPQQIGSLIGIGFAGQLVGAIGFGWLAERWGRRLFMFDHAAYFLTRRLSLRCGHELRCAVGAAFNSRRRPRRRDSVDGSVSE